jgi:alkanesulfonate monooxygenase SsuD/methylene tetrahydromethanopterin reductase-like flavin-dependent oxidoreductase (luciferase family)
MALLKLRYDLRSVSDDPEIRADLYRSALDQVRWADRCGFASVMLHEHHGASDGYLPSPIVMAAAVAAATTSIGIEVGALLVPLHDPLRLAEDLAVLDLLSRGRLTVVPGVGYVPDEYAMFGKRKATRGAALDRGIEVLRQAWSGEYFEYDGRKVRITPRPYRRPGPPIMVGGGSRAAAERAARIGDGFAPHLAAAWEDYRRALAAAGRPDPGPMPPSSPRFVYVSDDPERSWRELAPYLIHEMNAYGEMAEKAQEATGYRTVAHLDELRESPHYRVLTPKACLDLIDGLGPDGSFTLRPLAGGMDPALSWASLRLFETEVLPRMAPRTAARPAGPPA